MLSSPIWLAQTAIRDPRLVAFFLSQTPTVQAPVIVHQVIDHRGCLPTVSALPRCPQIRRRGEGTSKSPVPVRGSENHGKPRVT